MTIFKIFRASAFIALLFSIASALLPAQAGPKPFITVASTTSTQNSGLLSHILPMFEAESGINVRIIAVGTGQAIRIAKRGDADVLLVHHRPSEEQFVREGFGVKREDVMYNDFVIVGPKSDPAGVRGGSDAAIALAAISKSKAQFVSRADDSGTHKKEKELWRSTGIDPVPSSGTWYLETGLGMGAALNVAVGKNAYILADRGTWLSFENKGDLGIVVQGDPPLFNPYGIILVNPDLHPHIKAPEGRAFIKWITSSRGQTAIAEYKRAGEQLFYPNAVQPESHTKSQSKPAP